MIDEGRYKARATAAEWGIAGTGAEQIGVEFEILEGDFIGERISWYGFFATDKQTQFTIKALRAAGWQGDDLAELSSIDGSTDCVIEVEHEEYDGETRAKVKFVNKPGGIAMKTVMTPEQRRAFAARMKGAVLGANGGKPSAPPSNGGSRRPAPSPHPFAPNPDADDDINF